MRGLRAAVLAACLMFTYGCRKAETVQYVEEGAAKPSSVVNAGDPNSAVQLLRGFHDVEGGTWRWTMSKFALALRPPDGAAKQGATLFLDFNVPDVFIEKLQSTTLRATVDGKPLPAQTYSTAGPRLYEQKVPPEYLQSDMVTVEFTLDKFLEAGTVELRELGIIVLAAGLKGPEQAAPAAALAPK